jgi:hypothetical protein
MASGLTTRPWRGCFSALRGGFRSLLLPHKCKGVEVVEGVEVIEENRRCRLDYLDTLDPLDDLSLDEPDAQSRVHPAQRGDGGIRHRFTAQIT